MRRLIVWCRRWALEGRFGFGIGIGGGIGVLLVVMTRSVVGVVAWRRRIVVVVLRTSFYLKIGIAATSAPGYNCDNEMVCTG